MQDFQAFDSPSATELVAARQTFAKPLIEELRNKLPISSAADVGCGVGYFSKFLHELGLRVTGIDARKENVEECKRRYPDIIFESGDAEDLRADGVGTFDLVLCFGLLYHLENPFRAIRNLYSMTGQVLLVESMCAPGENPSMELLDEYHVENQGLGFVAFYPTEACLVKMLYRAGFRFVYGFEKLPDHEEFHATRQKVRRRTMMVASQRELEATGLRRLPEPQRIAEIWSKPSRPRIARLANLVRRLVAAEETKT